uniref:Uncharacterized protein n=1 Tax=Sphaerodactylus townsendi TaxID=933632 RepID=A0ACB8G984_9SAUR
MELLASFYKHRASKAKAALQQAQQKLTTQEKELKALQKENDELKKTLSCLKHHSPQYLHGSRNSTPRPVAVTPPLQSVTPRPSFRLSSEVVRSSFSSSLTPGLNDFTLHPPTRSSASNNRQQQETPNSNLNIFSVEIYSPLYTIVSEQAPVCQQNPSAITGKTKANVSKQHLHGTESSDHMRLAA